jgi:ankyrin repeat protein
LDAGADVNAQDGKGETPLYKVVAWNPYPDTVVEFLLDQGADPNIAERHFGWSPLHKAAEKGSLVSVAVLLGRGADLHAKNAYGVTALHRASQFASSAEELETVRLLLDWGAELDARNDFGETPLFGSVDSDVDGHATTTALLLERGADIMARDNEGSTALHRAASSPKAFPEVVELLLASGADARVENSKGLTPLDMAQRHGADPEIVRILAHHQYRPDTEPTGTPAR